MMTAFRRETMEGRRNAAHCVYFTFVQNDDRNC